MSDEKPELTMRDIGRRGGNKLKEKIGSEGYAELGRKGGNATAEHYARLAQAKAAREASEVESVPERGCCGNCGADLRLADRQLTGVCQRCGAFVPRPGERRFADPRRRHTPEEAARREQHGGSR
jgi:uncharacterized protein